MNTAIRNRSRQARLPLSKLWQGSRNLVENIAQNLLFALTSREEPRIRQARDRQGRTFWQVYDPSTGFQSRFSSEDEVRVWLEEQYKASHTNAKS